MREHLFRQVMLKDLDKWIAEIKDTDPATRQTAVHTVVQFGPAAQKDSLLNEIQACAQVQLQRLHVTWSPRGMWRLFLKRTASRRIERILGRVRAKAKGFQDRPISVPSPLAASHRSAYGCDPERGLRTDEE